MRAFKNCVAIIVALGILLLIRELSSSGSPVAIVVMTVLFVGAILAIPNSATKQCSVCAKNIHFKAVRCNHCGNAVPAAEPGQVSTILDLPKSIAPSLKWIFVIVALAAAIIPLLFLRK